MTAPSNSQETLKTTMKPKNLIVIMADEHSRKMLGCYGNQTVQTPNIDRLASRGTRFNRAYTPSPLCVPARAAFATGKPVHQIGAWDNAHAYTGEQESWHHRLRSNGQHVHSIGKLHFRGRDGDDCGFSASDIPMNIVDGMGDTIGLIRDQNVQRGAANKMADLAGPGESIYTTYDRNISSHAQIWLREQAARCSDKPWVLFVSFVSPHFPLTAPPEYFYRYDQQAIPMPKQYADGERPHHPYLEDYSETFAYDQFFKTPEDVKRAIAGYMGLCTFIDDQVGEIVRSVSEAGLDDSTRFVYTSDHGDNLGARGLWGKSNMYEESVGIPLIVAGPDIPEGETREEGRSLLDLPQFILESTGCDASGFKTTDLLGSEDQPVLSEYHGTGSRSAAYMLRAGRWKYVYYADYAPQLFDLETDPEELSDLAGTGNYDQVLSECHEQLCSLLDPDAVHQEALTAQRSLIDELGGVDAILGRGDFGFSPPPGTAARYAATSLTEK